MTVRKIVILHSFPGKAESESAERIRIEAGRAGIAARVATDDGEVAAADPDFVLCLSHHEGKTTPWPTYGVIMAPPSWFAGQPETVRGILGYDGLLTVSDGVRGWLEDLAEALPGRTPPVTFWANTCQATAPPSAAARPSPGPGPGLVYVGTNWDGWRNWELFQALARREGVRFHGPDGAWDHLAPAARGGPLPFDGESVLAAYRAAGAGLALDRADFRAADLPSSRIFEITAAGAVAVASELPFIRRHYGDTVLYLDPEAPPAVQMWQIGRHLDWISARPEAARELAAAAHAVFDRTFALERLLAGLLAFHQRVRTAAARPPPAPGELEAFCARWPSPATGVPASPVRSPVRSPDLAPDLAPVQSLDLAEDLTGQLLPRPGGGVGVVTGALPPGRDGVLELYLHCRRGSGPPGGWVELGDRPAGVLRQQAPLTFAGPTPSGDGLWRLALALASGLSAAGGLTLEVRPESAAVEVAGCRLRMTCDRPTEPLSAVAAEARLWLYGGGAGGRRLAALLAGAPAGRLAGVIDDLLAGSMDGRPMRPLAEAAPEMAAGDAVVIANRHWLALWRRLAGLPPRRLYTAHPGYGDRVARLPVLSHIGEP